MWLESYFPWTACSREGSGVLRKACIVFTHVSTAFLDNMQMEGPQRYDPRDLQVSEPGIP